MKITSLSVMLALLLPITVAAQQDDNWPSLSYLRNDYREASVVARVQVRKAEIVNRVGGYEDWHLVGEVIEPFKGKFRKGAEIDFYHGAEKGFQQELFLGNKIVFLVRNFVEKEKRWVLAVIENSTLPYTLDRVQKLRRIRREGRRKRAAMFSVDPLATARGTDTVGWLVSIKRFRASDCSANKLLP